MARASTSVGKFEDQNILIKFKIVIINNKTCVK